MKKKIYQIITVLFIIILFVGMHSKCLAVVAERADGGGGAYSESSSSKGNFTLDKIIEDADTFLEKRQSGQKFDQGSMENMIKSIYNILLVMGIIAVVIVGIILSIQFITGSLEEQAKVKEMLIPYIVGSVVIFTAFTIWKIVVDILQSVQDA